MKNHHAVYVHTVYVHVGDHGRRWRVGNQRRETIKRAAERERDIERGFKNSPHNKGMGQSASSTAQQDVVTDGSSVSPHVVTPATTTTTAADLWEMDDAALDALLTRRGSLTCDEIRTLARTGYVRTAASRQNAAASGLHFYEHDDAHAREDHREIRLATRLCRIPDVSRLRFRMVPSRVSEDVFWQAVFAALRERLVADDHNNTTTTTTDNHDEQESDRKTSDGEETRALRRKVQSQNAEIAALKKQVADLQRQSDRKQQHQHHKTHPSSPSGHAVTNGTSSSPSRHHPHHQHRGRWIVDDHGHDRDDVREFLELPSDVKTALRREKQRRLETVREEMRFILDHDDDDDAKGGHWDCCGATSYHAPSCRR